MAPSPSSNADHYRDSIKKYLKDSSAVSSIVEPITSEYHKSGAAACESELWTLWGVVLDEAISTAISDHESHQKLAILVKDIKQQGPIFASQSADTSAGRMWNDLPFLGSALRERWNDAPPAMLAESWTNLNMFVALLTTYATHDASLLGLWTLRMALEVRRPLTAREASDDSKRTVATVDELLPAACAWLSEGLFEHFANLCLQGKSFSKGTGQPDPGKPGELAKSGETDAEEEGLASGDVVGQEKMVARVEESGFNAARWRFWHARLKSISEMRDHAGGREKVAKVAFQTLAVMRGWDGNFGIKS